MEMLLANRYSQRYDVDYHDTFSLVAKLNSIRVVLFLPANLDWIITPLVVKNVFLHGDLEEENYMDILLGHTTPSKT